MTDRRDTVPVRVELTYGVTVDIPETDWTAYKNDSTGAAGGKLKTDLLRDINECCCTVIPHDWELVDVEVMGESIVRHE